MRIDDKQEKSSTTSSPQASPGSACGNSAKANGHSRIWSIVGDIETVRPDGGGAATRNWSPLRLEDKEVRDKTRSLDLSQTVLPDEPSKGHSRDRRSCSSSPFPLSTDLAVEADDRRSFDERSDAASSGNETSGDVEVEVI